MELIAEADLYSPSLDQNGNYVDRIPSFHNLKNGLRCPCGARKDKTYDTSSYFSSHIKTKAHVKWLAEVNANKANFFSENIQLKETINNQKLMIAKLEKEVNLKLKTIDYLTQQLVTKDAVVVNDLLFFD